MAILKGLIASQSIGRILYSGSHLVASHFGNRSHGHKMKSKITKRTVDQLSSGGAGILWDSEVVGFGVRCRPSGAKYYLVKMRTGGRQRWITVGRHGSPWTAHTARTEAIRLLGLKAGGQDPASDRDRQKGVITVAELGARFLKDYVPQHCKPGTAYEYRRAVELFINPCTGSSPYKRRCAR